MKHNKTLRKKFIKSLISLGFDAYERKDKWIAVTCYMEHGEEKILEIPQDVDIAEWIRNEIDTFDESYSAFIWLDEFGHGKNGAPYDMEDVLADQKEWTRKLEKMYSVAKWIHLK